MHSNKLYACPLPPDTHESELYRLFIKFGSVDTVEVIRDPLTQQCKGWGFITFRFTEDAYMLLKNKREKKCKLKFRGYKLYIKEEETPQIRRDKELRRLFVENIPSHTPKTIVSELFGKFGEVEELICNFHSKDKYCFVLFKDHGPADMVMKNDLTIGETKLQIVRYADAVRKEGFQQVLDWIQSKIPKPTDFIYKEDNIRVKKSVRVVDTTKPVPTINWVKDQRHYVNWIMEEVPSRCINHNFCNMRLNRGKVSKLMFLTGKQALFLRPEFIEFARQLEDKNEVIPFSRMINQLPAECLTEDKTKKLQKPGKEKKPKPEKVKAQKVKIEKAKLKVPVPESAPKKTMKPRYGTQKIVPDMETIKSILQALPSLGVDTKTLNPDILAKIVAEQKQLDSLRMKSEMPTQFTQPSPMVFASNNLLEESLSMAMTPEMEIMAASLRNMMLHGAQPNPLVDLSQMQAAQKAMATFGMYQAAFGNTMAAAGMFQGGLQNNTQNQKEDAGLNFVVDNKLGKNFDTILQKWRSSKKRKDSKVSEQSVGTRNMTSHVNGGVTLMGGAPGQQAFAGVQPNQPFMGGMQQALMGLQGTPSKLQSQKQE